MSILVDNKLIEVSLRYIDRQFVGGAVGTRIFKDKEEEVEWVSKENQRRGEKVMELKALKKEIPESLTKDAKDDVKELVTNWKRTDWGTQTSISDESQIIGTDGQSKIDYAKYRTLQMQKLMVGWNLKTPDDKPIEINPTILSRIDYNVAIALIMKYESAINPSEKEMENLE